MYPQHSHTPSFILYTPPSPPLQTLCTVLFSRLPNTIYIFEGRVIYKHDIFRKDLSDLYPTLIIFHNARPPPIPPPVTQYVLLYS